MSRDIWREQTIALTGGSYDFIVPVKYDNEVTI